ncbi:N-glycosylase/DNA lyase [Candidatus Woesearchaeota archaeon]|nr:N-glycosylase/DNA lyase [Candidatus Woesearchaeota archaeon]
MNNIIKQVNELQNSDIKEEIDKRIKSFKAINKKPDKEWFSELCFCLLTANTSAEMGIRVQKQLGYEGFTDYKDEKELINRLRKAKSRFYNRRGHFIHLANQFKGIKDILKKQKNKREWLVVNIKGLSYKEASHFLRNVGFFEHAIVDKHILRLLHENKLIKNIPKCVNKKCYLDYEKKLQKLADKVNLSQGELDLYLWYMKTGKVLK